MLPPRKDEIPQLYKRAMDLQASGDAAAAKVIYQRILIARPDQPEVLFQLGRVETGDGNTAAAETYLRKALKGKPTEPAIWQALHAVVQGGARKKLEREASKSQIPLGTKAEVQPILKLINQGQAEEAERRATALFRAAPAASDPAFALGLARAARGNWSGAVAPLETALARDGAAPRTKAELGRVLMRVGQPARAEALLRSAAKQGVDTRLSLARLLRDTCREAEATEWFEAAVRAAPRSPGIQIEHALTLAELRRVHDARSAIASAVRAGAKPRAAVERLARALETAGEAEAVLAVTEEALANHPGDPDLLTLRAQLRQTAGDLDEAETDLRAAIAANPSQAEAYRAYMNGRKVGAGDPVLAKLESRLGDVTLDARARRVMGFAAAKAMHDLRRFDEAAAQLSRANRLMAEAFPYGFEADLAEARMLVADWRDHLRTQQPQGPEDPVLFVTGLPRSGTTLAETILSAHPRVTAAGELPFLTRALSPAIEALRGGAPADFATAGARYLAAARRRSGARDVLADKAIATFSRIGHAAVALPGARFIVLRRDPRDVGLSIWRNLFADGMHRYAYDLVQLGRYIRLHDALVAFWAD